MADFYEVTTIVGRREMLAGRIYRARTSESFEYTSDYLRIRDGFPTCRCHCRSRRGRGVNRPTTGAFSRLRRRGMRTAKLDVRSGSGLDPGGSNVRMDSVQLTYEHHR